MASLLSRNNFVASFITGIVFCALFIQNGFSVIQVEEVADGQKIDFENDLLPIFKRNCLACHNTSKSKGDLNLETPQKIKSGGTEGVVIPGDPERSLLFISAAHQDEDLIMPPTGNKVKAKNFTPAELGILKRWIEDGAEGSVSQSNNIKFEEPVRGYFPVLSIGVSPNSQFVLCGRGNRLFAYDLLSGRLSQELLAENKTAGIMPAHKDLVHSIAIHPSGKYAISGDFKEINVWKRNPIMISKLSKNNLNGIITSLKKLTSLDSLWLGDVYGNIGEMPLEGVGSDSDPEIQYISSPHESKILGIYSSKHKSEPEEVITVSSDGVICGWDPIKKHLLWDHHADQKVESSDFTSSSKHGDLLLLGLNDGYLQVFNRIGNQIESNKIRVHSGSVNNLNITGPGGNFEKVSLISSEADSKIRFGLLDPVELKYELIWERDLPHNGMALSPVEGVLVVNAKSGEMQILNTKNGETTGIFSNSPDVDRRINDISKEITFLNTEKGYFDQQLTKKKKEMEGQSQRVEKAKKELSEKQSVFQKAKLDLRGKENEKKKLNSRLKVITSAIEKSEKSAEIAKSKLEKLENELIQSPEINEDLIKKLSARAFEAGQEDQKAHSISKQNTVAMEDLNKELNAIKKNLAESQKKFKESELQLDLVSEELKLAEQAVQRASMVVKTVEKKRDNTLLMLSHASKKHESLKQKKANFSKMVCSMSFSADDKALLTFDYNKTATLWDVNTFQLITKVVLPEIQTATIFETDGNYFLSGGGDGKLRLLDTNLKWRFERRIGSLDKDSPIAERVYSLDFSPDGNKIVVGSGISSRSGQILVFDFKTGKLDKSFDEVHSDVVYGVEFSKDGAYIASCSADKFVRVTDLKSGEIIRNLEGHSHYVMDLSWHRNGRTLVSASADNLVKVWDTSTGQKQKDIRVSNKAATSVDFIPYSNKFVTSGGDNSLSYFQTDGKKLRSYNKISDYMIRARTDNEGSIVVAGGQDGSLKIWNLINGKLEHEFNYSPVGDDPAKLKK